MIRLSTKIRYGTRAMVDICLHYSAAPVLAKDVAKRQGVSKKYLDSLLRELTTKGLLRSQRGSGGGFVLARAAGEITMKQIIEALGGEMALSECTTDDASCRQSTQCASRWLWQQLRKLLSDYLDGITLLDMARRQNQLCEVKNDDTKSDPR